MSTEVSKNQSTQVTKKDYSKLTEIVYQIELKQFEIRQNKPLIYNDVKDIPKLEEQIKIFKGYANQSKELRTPLTTKLDEVKGRLMETEKEMTDHVKACESNLLDLKKELKMIEFEATEKIRKEQEAKAKESIKAAEKQAEFAKRLKEMIDKNVEAFQAGQIKMDVKKFESAMIAKAAKLASEYRVTEDNSWIIKDVCKNLEFGLEVSTKEIKTNQVEVAVLQSAVETVDKVTIIETKDLKKVYELKETNLKLILLTWAKNFDFINSKLRVKEVENIKIGQIIDVICKHRSDIETDLVFNVKEVL